jgi:hypothetical protein
MHVAVHVRRTDFLRLPHLKVTLFFCFCFFNFFFQFVIHVGEGGGEFLDPTNLLFYSVAEPHHFYAAPAPG